LSPQTLILPNRNTVGLGAVLLAMWYAGASQNNGAAFLLCFALASVGAVSMAHAWANLRGLTLRAEPIAPGFAGEALAVPLVASAAPGHRHAAVVVTVEGAQETARFAEITPDAPQRATLYVRAAERGCFHTLTLRATSIFPLGFFSARLAATVRQTYHVYPSPAGALPLPVSLDPARAQREGVKGEGDDFAGVRQWRPGESMRHVDWKAVARGQPLLTKQWEGDGSDLFLLDWHAAEGLGTEDRLRQLARWAVLAERSGSAYGLRLPGVTILADRGEAHFHACLRALAEFDGGQAADGAQIRTGDPLLSNS
jgi:uncharacterized protein (DUF58 family)